MTLRFLLLEAVEAPPLALDFLEDVVDASVRLDKTARRKVLMCSSLAWKARNCESDIKNGLGFGKTLLAKGGVGRLALFCCRNLMGSATTAIAVGDEGRPFCLLDDGNDGLTVTAVFLFSATLADAAAAGGVPFGTVVVSVAAVFLFSTPLADAAAAVEVPVGGAVVASVAAAAVLASALSVVFGLPCVVVVAVGWLSVAGTAGF